MSEIEFSVPYNADPNTLPGVFALQGQNDNAIREVFLSGPQDFFGSGRIAPGMDFDEFANVVAMIHDAGMRVNLVLNSTCDGAQWYDRGVMKAMCTYLKVAHEALGVEAVTLANPLYIKEVHHWLPNLEISASVLAGINTVQKAQYYVDAGARVITPDVNVNRDLETLQRMKDATGAELKVMVNEGCLSSCPFRQFHFNLISHLSKDASRVTCDADLDEYRDVCTDTAFNLFFGNCNSILRSDTSQVLKSGWIRPEDLREYASITNFFKISGRTIARAELVRLVGAYMGERWDGNLFDLLDSSLKAFACANVAELDNKELGKRGFFKRVTSCDGHCESCSYCQTLAEELVHCRRTPAC